MQHYRLLIVAALVLIVGGVANAQLPDNDPVYRGELPYIGGGFVEGPDVPLPAVWAIPDPGFDRFESRLPGPVNPPGPIRPIGGMSAANSPAAASISSSTRTISGSAARKSGTSSA